MVESIFNQPNPEQLDGFLAGDPVAINEIVELLLPQIVRWAIVHYDSLPPDEVESMVHQVFAEVCINHARYEPQKSKLTTYVIGLLRLRLRDLYEETPDIHENPLAKPYNEIDTIDPNTRLTRDAFFQKAASFLDPYEQDFLDMMLKGEKSLEVFVNILARYGNLASNPDHAVKNTKERLVRKLRTIAKDAGFSLQDLID